MNPYLSTCRAVAKLGGQQLLEYQAKFQSREKAPNDLVTDADFAAQRVIHDAIQERYPDHCFLGEEEIDLAMSANRESEFRWIVDPLDGTLNYVHHLPSFSVSVALQHRQRIVAAAVYDPWLDELYAADATSAATLNGRPVRVSGCETLREALAVISLPGTIDPHSPELADFLQILYHARSVRRLGSAALNLCYVAAGRLDAYWATTVRSWDIAAGWLILQQAGGVMRDVSGQPLDLDRPRFIAAASEKLRTEIQTVLDGNPGTTDRSCDR